MHYSPQIALLEAITCALMLLFYFWHSWHYDRLQPMFLWKRSVKTTRAELDPTNSFHLIMRFIYLICLPIYIVQAAMIAYVKYQVGYLPVEMGGFPVPYTSWASNYTRLIYVSYYLKALGWLGEGIVHLEELAFWVFLINLKDTSPPWFKSVFFRIFVILSAASSGALVATVGASQPNVMLTQAVLMTVATGFNTSITLAFFWVFTKFPIWLTDLKKRGAPAELIIRLHGFGTLNQIRLIARLIFTVPLFALSADGLRAQPLLNRYVWVIDLTVMTSIVAFAAQGIITLLIFLPRNLSKECGYGQDDIPKHDKSSNQPLLNRALESGCGPRFSSDHVKLHTGFSTLPRPPSPSTSTLSPSEKHNSYNPDLLPIDYSSGAAINPPLIPPDANSFGDTDRNSNRTNLMNSQTLSVLTKCGRGIDRSSFVPQDLAQPFSPGISRISMESSSVVGIFASPSTSRSPSWLPPAREFSPAVAVQGSSIPFPISSRLTHFPRYFAPSECRVPRYFAPSECRAFDSFDGRSSKSIRSVSRSFSIKQAAPNSDIEAPKEAEKLDSIHPAIRYFKSPIDISSACFPEVSEKESLSPVNQ